ncbi:replication endonuclease [Symbiopectobacterium purcellii]|uniref:replication endonuclease n=1 Tax=Symbiopectobacterium purcellii TaxID=2871826 RepID=UPI003F850CF5
MTTATRGRHAPSPPLPYPGNAEAFTGVYSWNAPRAAIEPPPGLIRDNQRLRLQLAEQLARAQETLNRQPGFVQRRIREKMDWIERGAKTKPEGIRRANNFLMNTFIKRVMPRLDQINGRMAVSVHVSDTAPLAIDFNCLPGSGRRSINTLARAIVDFIQAEVRLIIGDDDFNLTSNDAIPDSLYAQQLLDAYRRAAVITQRFRRTPPGQAVFDKADIHDESIGDILDKLIGDIFRMCSEKWWLSQLTIHAKRWREALFIALGEVSKKKGKAAYASHDARCNHREQKRRNHEFLKEMELEDENGERASLIDKVYASVANPTIRRHELMVRVRGYNDVADQLGYEGVFLTLTAPSKYHATTRHGHFNPKWRGALPNETQRYFSLLWGKIRAKLGRKKLPYFGVRVAEAHHDGTPHWHMLLFIQPEHRGLIVSIFDDYACEEDDHELINAKARKARFYCEVIDKKKGSATGYIAKYIAKNIDGYALDGLLDDETHQPMTESARAIGAWASLWGIKQFQFLGSVPVSPWREFRKLNDHDTAMGLSAECAVVHDAANAPDWAAYVMAQGGPFVRRADLTVRPWYEAREKPNDYGEIVKRIRGIYMPEIGEACPIVTHINEYKIVPKKRTGDDGVTPSGLAVDVALDVGGVSAPSRSTVNNCTVQQKINKSVPPDNNAVIDDFDRLDHKERHHLRLRLRTAPREKVKNPLLQAALALTTPLKDDAWPKVRANTSAERMMFLRSQGDNRSPGELEKAWAGKVAAAREATARIYREVATQWEREQRSITRKETPGEAMLSRGLTPLEYQLDTFASSIGLSVTETQLKALTAGAVLLVEGTRYRARKDGVLYIVGTPEKPNKQEGALFQRLKEQFGRQKVLKRLIDRHCLPEEETPDDPIVWSGPYAR